MGRRGRPPHPDILTPREWEVLDLLRAGLSNEEIAERLGVSLAGAKWHVSEILSKLGVGSREEAARWRPERRPWWLAAVAPVGFLWRRVNASGVSTAVAAGVAVAVAAGIGLLVWGLVRVDGGNGGPQAVVASTTPGLTLPRPLSPPLVQTPEPADDGFFLVELATGNVRRLPNFDGTFSPDGGRIALASLDRQGLDVLTIATGRRVRVFDRPSYGGAWSPDGSQLAISVSASDVDQDVEEGLFIANADGSGYRRISDVTGALSWSPRGDRIAIFRRELGNVIDGGNVTTATYELSVLNSDSGDLRTIYREISDDTALAFSNDEMWSPSGSKLAFVHPRPREPSALFTLDIDTGLSRQIARDERTISLGQWSPDEEIIVFSTFRLGNRGDDYYDFSHDLHLVPSDGSAAPEHIANGISPSWSPDGRYLAFIRNWCRPPDSAVFDVAVYDRATNAIKTITPPEMNFFSAEFSPSDERIALHGMDRPGSIYMVDPDGSNLRRLLTWQDGIHGIEWTPTGDHIAFLPSPAHGPCD